MKNTNANFAGLIYVKTVW